MVEKWEYLSLNLGSYKMSEVTNKLNKYGDEGWEAVGVSTTSNAVGIILGYVVLLKRPQTAPYVDQFSAEQQALKRKLVLEELNAQKQVRDRTCRYCKKEIPTTVEDCPQCWPEIKK